MCKALSAVAWTLIVVCAFGCRAGEEGSQVAANPPTSSLDSGVADHTSASASPAEFRAVCYETSAHNGRPYILTKWLDSRAKAEEYGNYHGRFKEKFHHWKLEQREKK